MKSILIIEDEKQQAGAYQVRLGKKYDVTTAGSADEAFSKLAKNKFDMVVLDIMLPGGVNGFDFLKKLKSDPKIKETPVLIVTNLDEDHRQTALDLGAIDYMVKINSSLGELVERIDRYFRSRK